MRVIQVIDYIDFSDMRADEMGEPNLIYKIHNSNNTETYAISPDGIGFYFYDTLEELKEQH